ncbi:hypothetical protein [uncultured Oscillibacter sp.]|uniref:hypothetical protein n=1 Tax=uncultured Oscillibacter sp. TaxID=876091 RepID=UPI00262351EF|nr:hypothetical protein [uncultured Oscillibacter sp.]
MSIYVRDADGNRQKIAGVGLPGPAGKSAYQYAVEGGFSGTEEEFRAVVGVRSNPNLLDNWYFVDPINQRGQTEYGSGYTIDRWSSAKTIISDGYVSFQDNFIQSFEWDRFKPLLGKIVTLSYLNKDAKLTTATGAIPNSFESNELQGIYFGPFAMYVFPGGSAQVFRLDTSDTIIAAKLELGPVQTLAHKDASGNWVLNDPPPNKALELAKCQRYFLPVGTDTPFAGRSSVLDSSGGIFFIPTPVTMRANPSFDADLDHIIIYLPDGRKTHPKSITTSVYPNGIRVNFLTNESLGTSIALVVAISHPYKYYLDANL